LQATLYNLPTTTCHEMSHQIGYANESEANFIGFMASTHTVTTLTLNTPATALPCVTAWQT
jgi:hypothetical protein